MLLSRFLLVPPALSLSLSLPTSSSPSQPTATIHPSSSNCSPIPIQGIAYPQLAQDVYLGIPFAQPRQSSSSLHLVCLFNTADATPSLTQPSRPSASLLPSPRTTQSPSRPLSSLLHVSRALTQAMGPMDTMPMTDSARTASTSTSLLLLA